MGIKLKSRIILIASAVGAVLGLFLSYALTNGAFTSWESLGAPPEKATRILGGDLDTVFVQTKDGAVFGCFQFQQQGDCWIESEWPRELVKASANCGSSYWRVSSPPGEVIDKLELRYCGVEISSEVSYVLLKNGSIWERRHGSIAYASLFFLCGGTVAGLFVGALGGMFIASRSSKTKRGSVRP